MNTKTAKHTIGPWTIQKSEWANAPAIIRDIDGVEIAEVRIDESEDRPKLLANAALIGASPDLLEACQGMIAFLKTGMDERATEDLARLILKMNNAISKATKGV